jgi:hypothetical protein
MNDSELLKEAIDLLARWCDAIDTVGTGWDDWDEYYKDARWRPGPLRELIDNRLVKLGKMID